MPPRGYTRGEIGGDRTGASAGGDERGDGDGVGRHAALLQRLRARSREIGGGRRRSREKGKAGGRAEIESAVASLHYGVDVVHLARLAAQIEHQVAHVQRRRQACDKGGGRGRKEWTVRG